MARRSNAADCHQPTADGVRFLPVDMERDCEACHSLVYDRVGGTFRTLRHGDIAQMQRRPAPRRTARRTVRRPATAAGGRANSPRAGSITAGSPAAARLGRAARWSPDGRVRRMPHADHHRRQAGGDAGDPAQRATCAHGWFDHAAHNQEKCTTCHAANQSNERVRPAAARDRPVPHLPPRRRFAKAKVPSGCAMCHGYHPTKGAPALGRDDRQAGRRLREIQRSAASGAAGLEGVRAMLIAQITDIHIGFEPEDEAGGAQPAALPRDARRAARSAQPARHAAAHRRHHRPRRPRELRAAPPNCSPSCPCPVWPMVGNHDTRAELFARLPASAEPTTASSTTRSSTDGLRVICSTRSKPGRHGGAFCEARRAWLAARLDEAPDTPTLIFMHHPPVVSGIDWMDPAPDEPWVAPLRRRDRRARADRRDPLRPSAPPARRRTFAGIPLCVCPLGRTAGGAGPAPDRPRTARRPRPDHHRAAGLCAAPLGRDQPGHALRACATGTCWRIPSLRR